MASRPERIQLKITQEDIDEGTPRAGCECAAGRAIQRRFPKAKDVLICYTHARIDKNFFVPSRRLGLFMRRYDSMRPVKPGLFYLHRIRGDQIPSHTPRYTQKELS